MNINKKTLLKIKRSYIETIRYNVRNYKFNYMEMNDNYNPTDRILMSCFDSHNNLFKLLRLEDYIENLYNYYYHHKTQVKFIDKECYTKINREVSHLIDAGNPSDKNGPSDRLALLWDPFSNDSVG